MGMMRSIEYVVVPRDGAWTVRFNGRHFDAFNTQAEAIARAVEWAGNARRQGHYVPILLEEADGRTVVVDDPQGAACFVSAA